MVHTFELSKMLSRDMFNETIHSLKLRFYGNCWFTFMQYLTLIDKGYSLRTGSFERNYYENDEPDVPRNEITSSADEPDMPDIVDVLEQVEKGLITDLGTLKTVKRYLKEIESLGINPVTISARMDVPEQIRKTQGGGKDLSEKLLPGLVDILSAYGDRMEDYQKNGVPITDEDIEKIMKL